MSTEVIAVIPARGGSKGVPRKNLRRINGIPLVGRSVLAALAAKTVDRVYVSTDDAEIADAARLHGALVIDRPAGLSGDAATSEAALLHALDVLAERGESPSIIVFLQCTSPFTSADQIDAVVASLQKTGASSAFAAIRDHGFLWTETADGLAVGVNHDEKVQRKRRQDLKPQYRETGSIYALRTSDFRRVGRRFCGPVVLVPIDTPPVEIDTAQDLALCDAIASVLYTPPEFRFPASIQAMVMDFDGVLTDDRVMVTQDGIEAVMCSRGDGLGIGMLRDSGIKMLILSKERNPVVAARAAKLKVEARYGIDDKLPVLMAWIQSQGISAANTIYVGNDVNDLPSMRAVGWPVTPADAHPEAKRVARYVTTALGGRGAVREIVDMLMASQDTLA